METLPDHRAYRVTIVDDRATLTTEFMTATAATRHVSTVMDYGPSARWYDSVMLKRGRTVSVTDGKQTATIAPIPMPDLVNDFIDQLHRL